MDTTVSLLIKGFPKELRDDLRRAAFDGGTTLRELVIERLSNDVKDVQPRLSSYRGARKRDREVEPEAQEPGSDASSVPGERGSEQPIEPAPPKITNRIATAEQISTGKIAIAAPANQRLVDISNRINCDSRDCSECKVAPREKHRASCGIGDRLADRSREELNAGNPA